MAVKTKTNKVNPLTYNVPIANKDGTPTNEFMRKWEQQAGTNAAIPDLTTAAAVSAILDLIGLAQGDILYRDATAWKVLTPGTAGFILKTGGANANPAWESVSSALDGLGAVQGDILYRNATTWTVLAPGTDGQTLVYDGTAHAPKWSSSGGGVILGSGAPTSLQPAGTLYSRTDTAAVYSSQPTTAPPATVVQRAVNYSTFPTWPGVVTLGVAPTVGNLLIAFVGTSADATPNLTASWTLLAHGGTGSSGGLGFLAYRYVQAGDVAALPAICSGAGGIASWVAEVYEVTSVSGTIANDILSLQAAYNQTSNITTTGMVTTANNQTGLILSNQISQNSNITISGGWSVDDQQHVTASNGPGAWIAAHEVVSTSGTSLSATLTLPGATQAFYISVLLGIGGFSVAGWKKISVPTGGTTGQVLTKNSNTDLDTGWATPTAVPTAANPTATAKDTAVNGSAATYMRSDAAPAIQKASASQFGIVEVDGTTITAAAGVISAVAVGANPTATAKDTAVNGVATTFMRSDAAPAVQKASASQFGIVEVDGTTITATAGVITAALRTAANPTATASDVAVNGSAATYMRSDAAPAVQKASASQFGIVEVDGTTITATAGVISSLLAPQFLINSSGGSGQALTQNTWNKITDFGSPQIDTASGWDATNKVWKVPTGKAGTYIVFGQSFATFSPGPGANFQLGCTLTLNGGVGVGTSLCQAVSNNPAGFTSATSGFCMAIVSLAIGDKLQINTDPTAAGASNASTLLTYFGALRIGP